MPAVIERLREIRDYCTDCAKMFHSEPIDINDIVIQGAILIEFYEELEMWLDEGQLSKAPKRWVFDLQTGINTMIHYLQKLQEVAFDDE